VYITAARLRLASVSQISKVSKVRREDVYRIMPKLEKMGLIERILGKPTKIRATPVEEALSVLIKREQDSANKKMSALATKKDEFLEHFKEYEMKAISEEGHFALILQRDGVISRGLAMVKKCEREIDIVTSIEEFIRIFTDYAELLKKAIRKGVKVRVILDVFEHQDWILRIMEEYKSSEASFYLKYRDQPSGYYIIADNREALVATSTDESMRENPCLWTDDNTLVGLVQKNFEGVWQTSLDVKTIETESDAEKATRFIEHLRPRSHAIFLCESSEAKCNVLFHYVKGGLKTGEAAVCIISEEKPSRIIDFMRRNGVEVEKYEKTGALRILGYNDYCILGGKTDVPTTMGLIEKKYNKPVTKGFKGWLMEYERALHKVFNIPIIGFCAYNANTVVKACNPTDLCNELLKGQGTILFIGIDKELGNSWL